MSSKIIKSSSPPVNSRQLFRLNITASSLISVEHGPPLEPREQPQPLRRNFVTFSIISFGVSSLSIISKSAMACLSLSWNTRVQKHLLLWRVLWLMKEELLWKSNLWVTHRISELYLKHVKETEEGGNFASICSPGRIWIKVISVFTE